MDLSRFQKNIYLALQPKNITALWNYICHLIYTPQQARPELPQNIKIVKNNISLPWEKFTKNPQALTVASIIHTLNKQEISEPPIWGKSKARFFYGEHNLYLFHFNFSAISNPKIISREGVVKTMAQNMFGSSKFSDRELKMRCMQYWCLKECSQLGQPSAQIAKWTLNRRFIILRSFHDQFF